MQLHIFSLKLNIRNTLALFHWFFTGCLFILEFFIFTIAALYDDDGNDNDFFIIIIILSCFSLGCTCCMNCAIEMNIIIMKRYIL